MKETAKEIERISVKPGKANAIVDRQQAAIALALVKDTTKGFADLNAQFAAGKSHLSMTKQMSAELNHPSVGKVLATYKAMSTSLVDARRELEVISRLQNNMPVGKDLSYGYMRGVPGRAEALKENQIRADQYAGAGAGSIGARFAEIRDVYGSSGVSNRDKYRETSKAVQEEIAQMKLDDDAVSADPYNKRRHIVGAQFKAGVISKRDAYSRESEINQEQSASRRAASSVESAGHRRQFDDVGLDKLSTAMSAAAARFTTGSDAWLAAEANAATQLASAMEIQAKNIRDTDITAALKKLKDDFEASGKTDADKAAYKKGVANEVRRGEIRDQNAEFAKSLDDPEAVSDRAQLAQDKLDLIKKKQKEIDSKVGPHTKEDEQVLKRTQERIDSAKVLAQRDLANASAIDELSRSNQKLSAKMLGLNDRRAKGERLTRKETQELKALTKEYEDNSHKLRVLSSGTSGFNRDMHAMSQGSRRMNYQMQQASYGVQDFVQVFHQTGFSGAMRASANNVASLFGAMGTMQGALYGAGLTILMIGLAEAFKGTGDEAETLTQRMDRLNGKLEATVRAMRQMSDARMGMIDSGIETGGGASDLKSAETDYSHQTRKLENANERGY